MDNHRSLPGPCQGIHFQIRFILPPTGEVNYFPLALIRSTLRPGFTSRRSSFPLRCPASNSTSLARGSWRKVPRCARSWPGSRAALLQKILIAKQQNHPSVKRVGGLWILYDLTNISSRVEFIIEGLFNFVARFLCRGRTVTLNKIWGKSIRSECTGNDNRKCHPFGVKDSIFVPPPPIRHW